MVNRLSTFVLSWLLLASASAFELEDSRAGEWLRVLDEYRALGAHRTGSATDLHTSRWLAERLGDMGIPALLQSWPVLVFESAQCTLEVDGRAFESFPFWFPATTPLEGVRGPLRDLSRPDVTGAIALARNTPGKYDMHFDVAPLARTAADRGAVALVVIIDHPLAAVSAQNAVHPYHQSALAVPSLIVAETDEDSLFAMEEREAEARVVLTGDTGNLEALNVIATIDRGADRWVVISTPTSGWFEAVAERGPGIAMWLELARWAARDMPIDDTSVNFLFVALSGHELEKMGMRALVSSGRLPDPASVALWIHLGSGIAVREPILAAVSSSLSIETEVRQALAEPLGLRYFPEADMPAGSEMHMALVRGYPVLGLFGASATIHTRHDVRAEIDDGRFRKILERIQRLVGQRARATIAGSTR